MSEPDSIDSVRIGTQEREDSMRVLGDHFAAGRLQIHEYEHRVSQVVGATTRGDLRPLFADLPAPYPAFMAPPTWPAPPPAPMPVYPQYGPPPPMHHAGGYPPAYPPVEYSDKSRLTAGMLQILVPFGAGRFYTGHTGIAVAQLLTCGGFGIWSLVDGIILLANGGTDAYGRRLRD